MLLDNKGMQMRPEYFLIYGVSVSIFRHCGWDVWFCYWKFHYYFDIKKVPICLNFLKKGLGLEAHVAFVNR